MKKLGTIKDFDKSKFSKSMKQISKDGKMDSSFMKGIQKILMGSSSN